MAEVVSGATVALQHAFFLFRCAQITVNEFEQSQGSTEISSVGETKRYQLIF